LIKNSSEKSLENCLGRQLKKAVPFFRNVLLSHKGKAGKRTNLPVPLPAQAGKFLLDYSTVMALQGQASTQAPQLTQESSTITALSPSSLIASAGQASTQAPQPAQVSLSILAAIFFFSL
jgi:hypothetical protein